MTEDDLLKRGNNPLAPQVSGGDEERGNNPIAPAPTIPEPTPIVLPEPTPGTGNNPLPPAPDPKPTTET